MPAYRHLLAPGRIGTLELRNRIVMAPMGDCLAHADGTVSPDQAAYFEARARGGAGLLLVGSVSVSYPDGAYDTRQLAASHDSQLPGLTNLTGGVHRHGAKIAAQLVHNGGLALLDIANGLPMLVPSVPKSMRPDSLSMMVTPTELDALMSPYAADGARVDHRVADDDDLRGVVEQFVAAATRCRTAGFDGVELHAGHGYLIDQFLSPASNTRSDKWGGSLENRARLLVEIVQAVRSALGAELPLWMRINAVEHKAGGEQFDDQLRAIELAVGAGIDAVHVSAYGSTDVATSITDAHTPHRVGALADYASKVRAAVDVPVITVGRFEPDEADAAIADGKADFVAMGRKLLADPDLPNKLAAGRLDDVRPCIYQYRCIGNIFVKDVVHCVVNADTGREATAAARAPTGRSVLVIGGGAAGLESARALASAGHDVTIWEQEARLGGVLTIAGRADPLLDRYLGWLCHEMDRLGVSIELGRGARDSEVTSAGFDRVVVATGRRWEAPDLPGADLPFVHTIAAIGRWLQDEATLAVGERVVLVGGGKAALSLADACVARGRRVTIVEPTGVFGVELGLPGRFRLVHDLQAAGVELITGTVAGFDEKGVRLADDAALEADAVFITTPGAPHQPISVDAIAVGDCNPDGIGRLEGANLDARQLVLGAPTALRARFTHPS